MDLFTKRYIFNYDIQNKKILLKLDLESPIYDNKIINDYKIKRNLPLLLKLLQNNCSVIILTYNGDNNNKIISETIQEYLHDYKVEYLNKNYGIDVEQKATNIQNSILVLENTKFVSKELSNEQLASFWGNLCDAYVYDSLADVEKKLASSYYIVKYFPAKSFIGPLCKNELDNIKHISSSPEHPVTCLFGGSRLYNKVNAIQYMVNTTDNLLIGGAASFTFLKTYGCDVPSYEENVVNEVASVISVAKSKLTLPRDFLKADDLSNSNITQIKLSDIHPHEILGDIGNETLNEYINILDKSKSILFYGPLGICEVDSFQNGTKQILEKLKELTTKGVYTFIGGIDLIITLHAMGYKTTDFSYVSVAGNNTLNLLEHIIMPTLELIPNSASK